MTRSSKLPRLTLRFALVGIAQMAAIAAGFWALLEATRPRPGESLEEEAHAAAARLASGSVDVAALRGALLGDGRTILTAVDPSGAVLASTEPGDAPRCSGQALYSSLSRRLPPPYCTVVPLALPTGEGALHYITIPPRPPPLLGARIVPLVLLVVAVSSTLLAWSLVRPLRRLSKAAEAFGGGDTSARARVVRRDEIGDVARAFDDMADRIAQLLRTEKELIANVSHELRTPLARIRVAVDLATEGDAAVAKEALVDIREDLDELELLVSDVLAMARLELTQRGSSAIPPLRLERVDVAELVRIAAARFRSAHPDRELEVDAEPAPLSADAVLLRRVIDNLLENADKYTEDPSAPVTLRARRRGAAIAIEVTDRGVGIPEADLENVFQPFFRSDRSRTRATGGFGLGLALAKRIVDAHGGELELESSSNGTTTRVTLQLSG